jgi:ectoine hydroxylase-related dioxygenase (phytanoyl-CoA dioxygenase family)
MTVTKTVAQVLDDGRKLKSAVVQLYRRYVQQAQDSSNVQSSNGSGDALNGSSSAAESDVQQEYNRQREHLERNVEALKVRVSVLQCTAECSGAASSWHKL